MPKPDTSRYRTTNWSDYNACLRRRGSLSVWFDPKMTWHAERSGKRGHPETFFDSAIQTCLALKVLFSLPLRQTVGLVASLIEMAVTCTPCSPRFEVSLFRVWSSTDRW